MNRKVIKVISIVLMMLMMAAMIVMPTFGFSIDDENYNSVKLISNDTNTVTFFSGLMGTLINVIQVIGMAIAVIMLVYVAIKYMSASPEGKAEFKKSATAYIVGAVVLFGATAILQLIQNFATANLK